VESKVEDLILLGVRVRRSFYKVVREYMKRNGYATISDFLRDAIREKIKREAPQLFELLSKGER